MIEPIQQERRIVATGFGVIAANGFGNDAFWQSLMAAESGIAPITLFDASELRCRIAGEIKHYDISAYIDARYHPARMGRASQFSITASKLALDHAGVSPGDFSGETPLLINMGVSTSALDKVEPQVLKIHQKGGRFALPYVAKESLPNAVTCNIGEVLGVRANAVTVSAACPAGISAIQQATQQIKQEKYDIALAGGADAPLTYSCVAAFSSARALSERNDAPAQSSRPFDANRDGGVLAEGAAVFVLEELEHALDRGATPYLEILGFGSVNDAIGAPPASGLIDTMTEAIHNAGIYPEQIDYICAHAPSDRILDAEELIAIEQVFGAHTQNLRIGSIKGATGNPLAGVGPMQLATCAMAMSHGVVPPTTNFEFTDPGVQFEGISSEPLYGPIRHALINVHGYGGVNNSLIVKEYCA